MDYLSLEYPVPVLDNKGGLVAMALFVPSCWGVWFFWYRGLAGLITRALFLEGDTVLTDLFAEGLTVYV